MWSVFLRFIQWCWSVIWRYGYSVISKVVSWAYNNWRTVYDWIIRGIAWDTIIRWIRDRLGI